MTNLSHAYDGLYFGPVERVNGAAGYWVTREGRDVFETTRLRYDGWDSE